MKKYEGGYVPVASGLTDSKAEVGHYYSSCEFVNVWKFIPYFSCLPFSI